MAASASHHRVKALFQAHNEIVNAAVPGGLLHFFIRGIQTAHADEQVEQAARDCGCCDFIMSLEKGFDTVVGSGGGHLSGGDKQRICIARAMLKNAPVVILDEATAYTDPENEAIIQASVAKLVQGKTLIVIAHRLSTVTDADQIVVVKDGGIEAAGTHDALLESCPLYRNLWEAHISARDSLNGGEQNV